VVNYTLIVKMGVLVVHIEKQVSDDYVSLSNLLIYTAPYEHVNNYLQIYFNSVFVNQK